MNRKVFPLYCLFYCLSAAIVLAAAGCKPQAATTGQTDSTPPAPATVAPAASASTMTAAGRQATNMEPAPTSFDRTAFAGTFTGTLPCADCPGIEETLQLDPDGHFKLTNVYRERPGSTHVTHGTWSIQANGAHLRLVAEKKRDVDRLFAIDDNDTLSPLGMDGERIDSPVDLTLKRSNP